MFGLRSAAATLVFAFVLGGCAGTRGPNTADSQDDEPMLQTNPNCLRSFLSSTLPILGDGVRRVWSVTDTNILLRVVVVPVCNGNGSYVFMQTYADSYAKGVLDGWMSSFRWMGPGRPPVCEMLDPR